MPPLAPQQLWILAKQPLAGQVKTRLVPPLWPRQAAALAGLSLKDSLTLARRLPEVHTGLCVAGDLAWFARHAADLPCRAQVEGDLGARLTALFTQAFATGARRVCAIGSDSPDLPPGRIGEAFAALADHDVVIIPASDGGYVLIGCSGTYPQLFDAIAWSSPLVCRQSCERAVAAGLRLRLLPPWHDLDTPADLRRLAMQPGRLRSQRYARRCLRALPKS